MSTALKKAEPRKPEPKKPPAATEVARPIASPIMCLASKFNIEPKRLLEVLRGTVIKPDRNGRCATNEELAAFCIVAQQYGLNPFTREIHAFVSGDKGVIPIVGIDGWTHIVNARGDFDGCEFEEFAQENGKPDRITCRMFVKDRTYPVCATERYSECQRNTAPWNSMPWRMLRHKAYMQAARYAFGLSGIYDADEARDIIKNKSTGTEQPFTEVVEMPRAIGEAPPAQAEATEPEADSEPEAAEAAATENLIDADTLADDIREQLKHASTKKELEAMSKFITSCCDDLGAGYTAELSKLCADKLKALEPAKK